MPTDVASAHGECVPLLRLRSELSGSGGCRRVVSEAAEGRCPATEAY